MNTREDKISKMKKYFAPICSEISLYDEKNAPDEWFTQFNNGCILFSLVNGKFEKKEILTNFYFTPNENLNPRENGKINKKTLLKGVIYEYKAILVWYILTKNNVLGNKISEVSKISKKILKSNSIKDTIELVYDLKSLYYKSENQFAIKDEKNFNYAEWYFDKFKAKIVDVNYFDLSEEEKSKFILLKNNFLAHLPRYSLICTSSQHWVVFLGFNSDNNVIICDPKKFQNFYGMNKDDFFESTASVLIKK